MHPNWQCFELISGHNMIVSFVPLNLCFTDEMFLTNEISSKANVVLFLILTKCAAVSI